MKITSNSQYHSALAAIETFIERGFSNLSEEETGQLRQTSLAVETYEKKKYPMPLTTTIPALLEEYMHDNKLTKVQLSRMLEVPDSTMNEIINGKRKLNLSIVKKLHQKLSIDGNFLLESA